MAEGRTGERATGTPNEIYDLTSVLFHALEGGASYDQYIHDAEQAGDQELVEFFSRVRDEDNMRADEAQRLLAERTSAGARTGGSARVTEGTAAGVSPRTEASSPPPGVAEEVPPTRAGEATSRTEEAPSLGRDRGAGHPEREREEDKGLLDRARDELFGREEEEPRRREEPGGGRGAPRGPRGDEPLR